MDLLIHTKATIIASLMLVLLAPKAWSQESATYRPYEFNTHDSERIYFQYPVAIDSWGNDHLIVLDGGYQEIWILNVTTREGYLLGAKGQGPGEYSNPRRFAVLDDTLQVIDGRSRLLMFLLPSGKHLSTRAFQNEASGLPELLLSDGTFLSSSLPVMSRSNALFGRYSDPATLLATFGPWEDPKIEPAYPTLAKHMNSGILYWAADGIIGYFYTHQPRVLLIDQEGRVQQRSQIEMPWFGRRGAIGRNPWFSEQFGAWVAIPLVDGFVATGNDILAVCRGESGQYLARYTLDGTLQNYYSLPRDSAEDPMSMERVNGIALLDDSLFVIVMEAIPAIREVVLP